MRPVTTLAIMKWLIQVVAADGTTFKFRQAPFIMRQRPPLFHHDAEYTTVHHDATGHNEKVVDQAAWDETVTTGYKCSGCGVTK